jgi:hypothetical protein
VTTGIDTATWQHLTANCQLPEAGYLSVGRRARGREREPIMSGTELEGSRRR